MTYTSLLSKHLAFICKYTSKAFNQLISTTSSTSEATDVIEEEEEEDDNTEFKRCS